ncbi:MAG: hypothetical protein KatS3mg023_3904 [Armatimonadota bacterium]|nr:MAG: hypothetical protein KatS3mg023_3904 [Armatimonadota bacterium]
MAGIEATSVALAGGKVFCVGGDSNTASIIFEQCLEISYKLNAQVDRRKLRDPSIIRYRSGGYIMARSAENIQQLIGRGLDLIIIDECARIPHSSVWYESLRPALTDRKGGALFISTPVGRNWFYELFQMGKHPDYADYESFQYPSSSNPHLDPAEIENARLTIPERVFRQEYLAEFLEDVGGVFSNVRSRVGARRQTTRTPGHNYVIGVDLAKYEDFTVIAVIDTTLGELCNVVRLQKEDYTLQSQRIIVEARRWNAPVCVDSSGPGEPIVEVLFADGVNVIPFKFTNASKMSIVQALVLALEQEDLKLLDEEWLLQELENYQYERTEAGNLRMNAPSGKHDDGVMALALAWHIAQPLGANVRPQVGRRRPIAVTGTGYQ